MESVNVKIQGRSTHFCLHFYEGCRQSHYGEGSQSWQWPYIDGLLTPCASTLRIIASWLYYISLVLGRKRQDCSLRTITGYPLELHFKIPCVFPVWPQIFPVPIYMICDYYIYAKLTSEIFKYSLQIPKYLLLLESGNLRVEQTKFPVFWPNFQIPCVFPDREYLRPFSLFSLRSGYPVLHVNQGCFCKGR